jgi:hypothetical protein
VVATAAIVTGCAAETGPGPASALPELPKVPDDLGQVSYPLDKYRLSAQEDRLVDEAIYALTQRCVRRFGLTLPPIGKAADKTRRDRYGLADETEARTWAYSLDKPSKLAPAWFGPIATNSRLYTVVTGAPAVGRPPTGVRGLPAGGCGEEARRALAKTPDDGLVDDLDSQAWRTSRTDSRVEQTVTGWTSCMSAAGYQFTNPVEEPYSYWGEKRMSGRPALTPQEKKTGIRPTAAEIEAALTDVRCKRSSGFLQSWVTVAIGNQQQLVGANQVALAAHRRSLDTVVRAARAVVARQ